MKQNRRESALFALPLRCLPELSVGLSTIQACHKGTPQTLQTKALIQRTQSDVLVTFQRSFYLQSSGYSCPQRNPKMFLKNSYVSTQLHREGDGTDVWSNSEFLH